jgi:hypothetical protein
MRIGRPRIIRVDTFGLGCSALKFVVPLRNRYRNTFPISVYVSLDTR